mmetsp:Transcript_15275/g.32995  ORF Transcript_15275/g.32995 Transcript_15275/m.32995 type:complete len:435 (+) Transcript_15275:376-1680(+)|eukprot:CAMPEP_0206470452 /NCGR_PEP_ID=MMETSP0324_2-20121206/30941_1 /ASSEMBLY_ACC=CAM_ASM_000836 /TAXON_ID=2866 /ORGANISM="Crypthecodinium cohnii, Strain Seligo" /LENGTH=434 /DNA_ID=CAMNT_0053944519 /DNA_START=357 /DNA_END=1661 /DNA_ORIENTATION=+
MPSSSKMMFACCVVASTWTAATADLRAASLIAARRAASGVFRPPLEEILPSAAVVVPLRAEGVPGLHGDEAFYTAEIGIGNGEERQQRFSVLFDTASGNVLLPAEGCASEACRGKRLYFPGQSSASEVVPLEDVEKALLKSAVTSSDGLTVAATVENDSVVVEFSQLELGDGLLRGHPYRDNLCLTPDLCGGIGLLAVESYTEAPFRSMPHDGILGLSLDGLALSSPLFSTIRSLGGAGSSLFSLALRGPSAEIGFGGLSPTFTSRRPIWRPVNKLEEGYWQVKIFSVIVGNLTVHPCLEGCTGIIDTGAARLGVPSAVMPKMVAATAVPDLPSLLNPDNNCCPGPDIHLDLGGGDYLTLPASTYAGRECNLEAPRVVPLELGPGYEGAFVIGLSLLKHYDTIYDFGLHRLGFAAVPSGKGTSDLSGDFAQMTI